MIDFSRGLFACFVGMPVDCFQMDSIVNSLRYSSLFSLLYIFGIFLNFEGSDTRIYFLFSPPLSFSLHSLFFFNFLADENCLHRTRRFVSWTFIDLSIFFLFFFFFSVKSYLRRDSVNGIFGDEVTNIGSFERGFPPEGVRRRERR